jgi:uncharacterized damage-inducible protein DinB
METENAVRTETPVLISNEQLLEHWQGHRRVSRRVIEAFPGESLFSFSIGGMRTYASLAMEMIDLALGIEGITTGVWPVREPGSNFHPAAPATKAGLLQRWDEVTLEIERIWPHITPQRFQETDKAFGLYESPVYAILLYFIDNEIHHRGQGYVYLRALGIQPPAFPNRE